MPAVFMEAYKQALALETITVERIKQFVSVQAGNVQSTEESQDIELAAVKAQILNFRFGSKGHQSREGGSKPGRGAQSGR
jgi:hypothetical protein